MKVKDIKDVLTFRSFRPEPDDSTASWPKRFPKEKTLMLNVNKAGVSWAGLEKGTRIGNAGSAEGTFKEVAAQMSEEWRSLTEGGWCSISLSTRYVVSLEANLSRRKGNEEQIKTNPKGALGAKAERGKRYSVRHNNESNTSVLLAVEEEIIKRIETTMKEVGLKTGRISCGTFVLLSDLIDQVADARRTQAESNPDTDLGTIVMVTCCHGSVCAVTQQGDQWVELRSRSDIYEGDDMEPALNIVMPLIENAGSGAHVVFMNDEVGSTFPALLQQKASHVRVSDVTVENQLWKQIGDL